MGLQTWKGNAGKLDFATKIMRLAGMSNCVQSGQKRSNTDSLKFMSTAVIYPVSHCSNSSCAELLVRNLVLYITIIPASQEKFNFGSVLNLWC